MSKLLHAGARRYLISPVTWISVISTVILGIYNGNLAMTHGVIDGIYLLEFFIFVFFISFSIGREFDENVIRNKIISGHCKGKIFLSEFILAALFATVLFLIHAVCFFGLNFYIINGRNVPPSYLIIVFVGFYLCSIFMTAIITVIAFIIPKRAIILVVSAVLVAGIVIIPDYLQNNAYQEQFVEVEYFEQKEVWENGEVVGYVNELSRVETEENPRYIKNDIIRNASKNVYEICPVTPIYKNGEIMDDAFGQFISHYYVDAGSKIEVNKEDGKLLKDNIAYTLALTTAIIALGCIIFKKKDLK